MPTKRARRSSSRVASEIDNMLVQLMMCSSDLHRFNDERSRLIQRLLEQAIDLLWPHRSVAGGPQPDCANALKAVGRLLRTAQSVGNGRELLKLVSD